MKVTIIRPRFHTQQPNDIEIDIIEMGEEEFIKEKFIGNVIIAKEGSMELKTSSL